MTTKITTCTISEALKNHLNEIKGSNNKYAADNVETLSGAFEYLIDNPYEEKISIEGYEKTLDEPVKVSEQLLERIRALKIGYDVNDLDAAVRERANIEHRELGETPVVGDIDLPDNSV